MGAVGALWRRRFHVARVPAVGQVAPGWALPLYPFLVPPDISITEAAAPLNVLRPVLRGVAIGLLILVPSFLNLFAFLKAGTAFVELCKLRAENFFFNETRVRQESGSTLTWRSQRYKLNPRPNCDGYPVLLPSEKMG